MWTFYDTIMMPALEAVGLPASRPLAKDGTLIPAVRGVRLHDLRHTFAVLELSAGVHFMQVSKWLGHGTFTLTLDTYGDGAPQDHGGALNDLPAPTRVSISAPTTEPEPELVPVILLFGR
ncbi:MULTISPECIES: hypothetical protein [unclassified Mycobacterium]|uniref:hypothetical protein n=1 Tax=unclassified Mycobacterium TaxID=2642494 RepID=UPI003876199C